jgi:hypothetical protein
VSPSLSSINSNSQKLLSRKPPTLLPAYPLANPEAEEEQRGAEGVGPSGMNLAGSILEAALQAVGRGLDAAGDHRLLYCRGAGKLVALDEAGAWNFTIEGGAVLPGVPSDVDVERYRGSPERIRPVSPGASADEPFVCSFQKVSRDCFRLGTSDRIVRAFTACLAVRILVDVLSSATVLFI